MKKLKTVIIGCGNIFTMHVTPVMHRTDTELVGVCDIKKDRADKAAKKFGTVAYYDYEKMLTELKPDIAHVCLPHYLHPVASRFALEHGVNVLSEKPMSIRYADGEECVKAAEKNGVNYGVIFQCRYNDASQLVKKTLESGELGKVISARSTLTWFRPDDYYNGSDWKGTWDKEGGGVIIDQAIHSLDLVNWFVESEPAQVSASYANRGHCVMEVEDTSEGLITYENGTRYAFWAMNNYGCDEPIEIRLLCEKGKVVLTYDDAWITFTDGREVHVKQSADNLVYENGKDYWGFQHVKQIDEFYRSVHEKRAPEISGKEALKIQKIVCGIYESGKTGKPVKLK